MDTIRIWNLISPATFSYISTALGWTPCYSWICPLTEIEKEAEIIIKKLICTSFRLAASSAESIYAIDQKHVYTSQEMPTGKFKQMPLY